MKKRLFLVAMIFVLLAMAGCQGSKDAKSTPELTPPSTSSGEPTSTPTPYPRVENATSAENFDYSIMDGEVWIHWVSSKVTELRVPDEIEGYPVVGIALAQELPSGITDVVLPYGLTAVQPAGAFEGTAWLENQRKQNPLVVTGNILVDATTATGTVKIPEQVVTIADGAFYGASEVTDINIPGNVTNFGAQAFEGTAWLEKKRTENPLVIVNNVLLDGTTAKGKVTIPEKVMKIAPYAFAMAIEVTEVVLPDGLVSIGYAAFGATGLTHVEIPDSVRKLEMGAFLSCASLASATLPKGITTVSSSLFQDCTALREIQIPEGVTEIETAAFRGCSALKEVIIPDGVTIIKTWAFDDCTSLANVQLSDSITVMEGAFRNCISLKEIALPEKLQTLDGTFSGCTSLEKVTFRGKPEEILGGAFSGCIALKSIEIPDSVTVLEGVFKDCTSLKEITLPEKLQKLDGTFSGCTSLEKVTFRGEPEEILWGAFSRCIALKSIEIPDSVVKIDEAAFSGCNNLTLIVTAGSYAEEYAKKYAMSWGFSYEIK